MVDAQPLARAGVHGPTGDGEGDRLSQAGQTAVAVHPRRHDHHVARQRTAGIAVAIAQIDAAGAVHLTDLINLGMLQHRKASPGQEAGDLLAFAQISVLLLLVIQPAALQILTEMGQ